MTSTENVSTEIVRLFSRLNKKELPYCAILPAGYKNSKEKFPVLYLLHGLFGRFDNWLTNTNLVSYAKDFPFVIICADGNDGWYSDSSEIENHFFESYLTEELISDVEQRFRVKTEQNHRAVAGLSMGGYGAFKLAFRRPEMFCFAGSMSGAFHAAQVLAQSSNEDWSELLPSITKIFGAENSRICAENDLFQLVNNYPSEQITRLPYFYFDCGTQDSFLPINRRLAEIFRQKKISFEFQEVSGGHDWDYWNRQILPVLRATGGFFHF